MWQSLKLVWPLLYAQGLAFTSVTQAVFSATLSGQYLGQTSLATLPIALLPIGTALGIIPMTQMMSRIGRRHVFMASVCMLAFANVLAGLSLRWSNFYLFCVCFVVMGFAIAALSQLRFAAMEIAPQALKAGAASSVLLGGIAAAFTGPEIGLAASHLTSTPFEGSHYAVAAVVIFAVLCFGRVSSTPSSQQPSTSTTPRKALLSHFPFWVAMSCGAIGYAVMSYVMTATPISMHHHFAHSLADTKWVIQSHVMAMFLPSLFTTYIVKKTGLLGMIWIGLGAFGLSIATGYMLTNVTGFWFSLVLLGIAWNFMFVGATILLPTTHSEESRFAAQGINDLVVFSVQAAASLSAGMMLSWLGWEILLLSIAPVLLVQSLLLVIYGRNDYGHK